MSKVQIYTQNASLLYICVFVCVCVCVCVCLYVFCNKDYQGVIINI